MWELTKGTRENEPCSNRGICDPTSGICTCITTDTPDFDTSNGGQPPFLGDEVSNRGDCGYPTKVITSCHGEIACSAHGVCAGAPTYRCTCSTGYTGADCSEFACGSAPAWTDLPIAENVAHQPAECANVGHCDRTKGVCLCAVGFEGGACNRMSCDSTTGMPCSGNGRCLPMRRLSEEVEGKRDFLLSATSSLTGNPSATSRGKWHTGPVSADIGESTPISYGEIPNNPATWDFEAVQGCLCDKGFMGFDCFQRTCPTGADPMVDDGTGGRFEVQDLGCTRAASIDGVCSDALPVWAQNCDPLAHDGYPSWRLSFRGGDTHKRHHTERAGKYTTSWLKWNARAPDVKAALEELDSIGEANVTFTLGDHDACTPDRDNRMLVTFLTEFGNLPDLKAEFSDSQLVLKDKFQVLTDGAGLSIKGSKEDIECSGRGLCDRATGKCRCFKGYTSSDGRQRVGERPRPGDRGDCGAVLEYDTTMNVAR